MAPEQAGGEGVIGPPADVYSLGAMLFELLAGRPPFPGDDAMAVLLRVIRDPAPDVRTLRPDVPRDLAAVVMKRATSTPHCGQNILSIFGIIFAPSLRGCLPYIEPRPIPAHHQHDLTTAPSYQLL
jgi:serine/threonine protein kinase